MNIFAKHPATRWIVPAVVAVAAIAAPALGKTLLADAAPSLPERSAEQLVTDVLTSDVDGLSGTVVYKADLGIPALPLGEGAASAFGSLTNGTHTMRVWVAGKDKQRIALLDKLGETDVVRNGRDLWTWSSKENTATHTVLPEDFDKRAPERMPADLPTTPEETAEYALRTLGPSTEITTDGTAKVAGRDAYELVLAPKDTKTSLVKQVRLAIDADNHAPLRVRVFADTGSNPALEVGYTQVSFTKPGDEHFEFTPPRGATVEKPTAPRPEMPRSDVDRRIVGETWGSVLVVSGLNVPEEARGVLKALPSAKGDWGTGRVLKSRLFTALLTDDGRLLLGPVTAERLYDVAGQK